MDIKGHISESPVTEGPPRLPGRKPTVAPLKIFAGLYFYAAGRYRADIHA